MWKGVVGFKWLILDNFHFWRAWWFWKDWFWIIGWFCFAKSQCIILEIVVYVFVCVSVDSPTVQRFWLNWPMANSANAIGLYHHCQCWHHCLLCTTLLIMCLMLVSSYVAYILAYFPHWCTLRLWTCDIWEVYLLLTHIWQWHGKLK